MTHGFAEERLGSPNSLSSSPEFHEAAANRANPWKTAENSPPDSSRTALYGKQDISSDEATEPGPIQYSQRGHGTQTRGPEIHADHQGQFILTLDAKPEEIHENDTITVTIPPTNDIRSSPPQIPYTLGIFLFMNFYFKKRVIFQTSFFRRYKTSCTEF